MRKTASELIRRWNAITFRQLKQPTAGYFIVWIINAAAMVGVLIGGMLTDPRAGYLVVLAAMVVVTVVLYYVYLGVQIGFDRIEQWWFGAFPGDTNK